MRIGRGLLQILLLDIEMGGMDGVTMARKVRQADDAVQIIFITGYSDYIAEGYEVEALNYLMKPVDEEKLFSVLGRAAEKLRKNERTLTLDLGGGDGPAAGPSGPLGRGAGQLRHRSRRDRLHRPDDPRRNWSSSWTTVFSGWGGRRW